MGDCTVAQDASLTIRVPSKLAELLDKIASEEFSSRSHVARSLLIRALRDTGRLPPRKKAA
jgi:metal-responsive CopG/Arc/MetJ family transcriptional regulator